MSRPGTRLACSTSILAWALIRRFRDFAAARKAWHLAWKLVSTGVLWAGLLQPLPAADEPSVAGATGGGGITAAGRDFLSFRRLSHPHLPKVQHTAMAA